MEREDYHSIGLSYRQQSTSAQQAQQSHLDQSIPSTSSSHASSQTNDASNSNHLSQSSASTSRSVAPAHTWSSSAGWPRSASMFEQANGSSSSTSSSSEWSSFLNNHASRPSESPHRPMSYASEPSAPLYALGGLPSSHAVQHPSLPWQIHTSPPSSSIPPSQLGQQNTPYYAYAAAQYRTGAPASGQPRLNAPERLPIPASHESNSYMSMPSSHSSRWKTGGMDLSLSADGSKLAPSFHQAAQASMAAAVAAAAAAGGGADGHASKGPGSREELLPPPVGPSYRIYDTDLRRSPQLMAADTSPSQERSKSSAVRGGAPPPVNSEHWYDPESPVMQAEPPASDFEVSDPKMIPTRNEKMRSSDDRYTPTWVRGLGKSREAWCDKCPNGGWFKLKVSAYWFHVLYRHGVSQVTGQRFEGPVQTRTSTGKLQRVEGLCRHCKRWITTSTSRNDNNWVGWFKHSHACHPTSRRLSPDMPGREGDAGSSAALVYAATDPRVYSGIPHPHMTTAEGNAHLQPSGSVAPTLDHHSHLHSHLHHNYGDGNTHTSHGHGPSLHPSYALYRGDSHLDIGESSRSEPPASKRQRSS